MPRLYITLAPDAVGGGDGGGQHTDDAQTSVGVRVRVNTITRILEHHPGVVEEYAKTIKPPCTGDKWGCDEKMQKVRGKESYVVAVMDLATRFVLAWDISSSTKEKVQRGPPAAGGPGHGGQDDSQAVYHRRPGPVPHRLQEGLPHAEGPQVHPHTRHPHPEPHMQHQQAGAPQRGVRWPASGTPAA